MEKERGDHISRPRICAGAQILKLSLILKDETSADAGFPNGNLSITPKNLIHHRLTAAVPLPQRGRFKIVSLLAATNLMAGFSEGKNRAIGPPAGDRRRAAASNPRRSAPQQNAQLRRSATKKSRKDSGRVFCYPDPAALGGVVRVSKAGFYGTGF